MRIEPTHTLDPEATPDRRLRAAARACVGQVELARALSLVREEMLEAALTRAGGNKSAAAALLGISRQRVQQGVAAIHAARQSSTDALE